MSRVTVFHCFTCGKSHEVIEFKKNCKHQFPCLFLSLSKNFIKIDGHGQDLKTKIQIKVKYDKFPKSMTNLQQNGWLRLVFVSWAQLVVWQCAILEMDELGQTDRDIIDFDS